MAQPRRGHLFHDLITQVFLRSLQYGIVVMGLIEAFFVYAHNHHRRNIENPGNLGDCMKGRIRFMTAITSAHAHAYQVSCLTRHVSAVQNQRFRLPSAKARHPHLPNVRPTTRERGNDFQGWAIFSDGGTRLVDGETLTGWGAVARSPHGRNVMFGPVITAEAHLAFAGARTHSSNTAEMSAMVEALSFLGPHGPVARDRNSCVFYDSKHAAGVCLGTIQARAHIQLAFTCQQSLLKVQHRQRFTMQHVYGHTGNLGNECADHVAACGALGLVSNHGLIILLIPSHVLLPATTLAMSWTNCVTLEQSMFLPLSTKTGDSTLFFTGLYSGSRACITSLVIIFRSFPSHRLLWCFC